MQRVVLALITAALVAAPAGAGDRRPPTAEDRVRANVPPDLSFQSLMRRDLLAYFREQGLTAATSVEYQLLRTTPTQSGTAYPKFYLWVRVLSNAWPLRSGAVRVAAIGQQRFDITHFVARDEIVAHPEALASVFPAALLPDIRGRAAGG